MRNQLAYVGAILVTVGLSACGEDPVTGPEREMPSLTTTDGETECVGTLPPGEYDYIVVPPNATCELNNSVIHGDIIALENSRLLMNSDQVGGSVEAYQPFQTWVVASTVGRRIYVSGGQSAGLGGVLGVNISGGTTVRQSIDVEWTHTDIIYIHDARTEQGSVRLVDNTTEVLFQFEFNTVGRNVNVARNNGPSPKFVSGNTVVGSLRCVRNTGAFFHGGPNNAGSTEGQCF